MGPEQHKMQSVTGEQIQLSDETFDWLFGPEADWVFGTDMEAEE
jgi:hypothetical protein